MPCPAGRHLTAPGIVNTHKNDRWNPGQQCSLHPALRAQPVPGELLDLLNPDGSGAYLFEQVERACGHSLDIGHTEHRSEFGNQVLDDEIDFLGRNQDWFSSVHDRPAGCEPLR